MPLRRLFLALPPALAVALLLALPGCRALSGLTAPRAADTPADSAEAPRTFAERQARHAAHKQQLLAKFDLSNARLDLADLYSPGVDIDGIASLDDPERWNAADASFPADDGRVIEVAIGDEAMAYPLAIMGAHEVANDTVGGVPVAVTYCPLCDSASVFERRLPSGEVTQFGVSGLLYRSNLTMYDRATRGLWSQAGLASLTGPYAGYALAHLPVKVVTFGDFKRRHPAGQVLSPITGHDENYEETLEYFNRYVATDELYMPVAHDNLLPPKTLGLGLKLDDFAAFVPADAAQGGPAWIETPAGPAVIEASDAGVELVSAPPGAAALQTFYFAWSAFHPDTQVFRRPVQTLLDGTERSFLVVGYSTSYAWPDMLQDMLDRHAGGQRVYHVLNAVVGGAAVERWIAEPGTTDSQRTVGAMVRDYFGPAARLRGPAPEPTIALCQQSLQFTRTQRGPVAGPDDAEGIRIGADALDTLAARLRDLGLQRIYFAMHIYKQPVEPEVGNERLALAALLERGRPDIYAGPDLWTVTRDRFPDCFEDDRIHPNQLGMKMMAEGWYRTIAGADARQDVIDAMYARDYDVNSMMRAYIFRRRGQ